ncbi:hypothetical protein [Protofrankia symbiont of Coriaria ruscifolia]|uniref:hypothetical protein n=1 Tax=Protofrankia symbiont of Coriaria ruscifolia TaxID=1306542 RepID=UPI0010410FFF|nr:hypothetical protein [Protofrankia symbiont of Coriaria ruscifolia]
MTAPRHGATAGEPTPDGEAGVEHRSTPVPAALGAQAQPSPWAPVIGRDPGQDAPAPGQAAAPARSATTATTAHATTAQAAATQGTTAQAVASQAVASPHTAAEARALPGTAREGAVHDGSRPPNSTVPGGHGPRGLTGRLARLRIGSHTTSGPALAQLGVTSPGSGLILGADRYQQPVRVRFFRPEPTRVTLLSRAWAGKLIVFRALALGARVTVVTTEPREWDGFGERATGHGDRLRALTVEQPLTLAATAQRPVLLVHDLGMVGASAPPPLGPWQTQLTILRQLDRSGIPSTARGLGPPGPPRPAPPAGEEPRTRKEHDRAAVGPLVRESHLVVLQRLGGVEAALVGGALRLPGHTVRFLQSMADDMVALVGDGVDRHVWLRQTDVERGYTGGPSSRPEYRAFP